MKPGLSGSVSVIPEFIAEGRVVMAKQRAVFTFTAEVITEPIIFNLGQQFNLVTNIRRANITKDKGWIELDLEGEEKNIEAGVTWAISRGVRVDLVTG